MKRRFLPLSLTNQTDRCRPSSLITFQLNYRRFYYCPASQLFVIYRTKVCNTHPPFVEAVCEVMGLLNNTHAHTSRS